MDQVKESQFNHKLIDILLFIITFVAGIFILQEIYCVSINVVIGFLLKNESLCICCQHFQVSMKLSSLLFGCGAETLQQIKKSPLTRSKRSYF